MLTEMRPILSNSFGFIKRVVNVFESRGRAKTGLCLVYGEKFSWGEEQRESKELVRESSFWLRGIEGIFRPSDHSSSV